MSTVYPFRLQGKRIICVYCCDEFEDPDEFRSHVDEKHTKINVFTAFAHIGRHKDYLKVDCYDLRCRICSMPCESIENVARHLKHSHTGKEIDKINLKYEVAMHPYNLIKDKWVCLICNKKMPSLTKLGRHMSSHYSEYTCDTCGRCYLTVDSLNYHIKFNHSGKNICRRCWQDFPTTDAKRDHIKNSINCRPFGCIYCGERFTSWDLKHKHQVSTHQVREQTYPCPECDEKFQSRKHFYNHYTISHTQESLLCTCCGRTFANQNTLDDHKLGHSGEKLFQCSICSKGFTRRKSLKQHLWIHSETKRFVCIICNKQFNQKVSLKGHMKSHHPNVPIEF